MPKQEPSLVWLSSVDSASIRGQLELAARTLRAVKTGVIEPDYRYWAQSVRNVVAACVEAGPGQLDQSEALQLLFPLSLILQEHGTAGEFADELRALMSRDDIRHLREFATIRDKLHLNDGGKGESGQFEVVDAKDPTTDPVGPLNDAEQLVADLPALTPPLAEATKYGQVLDHAAELWTRRRRTHPPEDRGTGDTWFMRALTLAHRVWPITFVEAVYRDDEVWGTDSLGAFAQGLAHPLLEEPTGVAASALINARIRQLRPRLFLRFPETLLIQAIGHADTGELVRGVMDLVAEPLIRTAEAIDQEVSRPNDLRPRKGAFTDIRSLLSQVLGSLGYEFIGAGGDVVKFDSTIHITFTAVEDKQEVTITRPGLRAVGERVPSVKAQVNKVDATSVAGDSSMAHVEEDT